VNPTTWRLGLGAATLAGCLWVVFAETEGLRVLTSDRLPAVHAARGPAFAAPLQTSDARSLSALPAPGTLRVVEITYERCRTVCAVQGESLAEAFRALRSDVDANRLHFVSLSVDPGDCPAGIERRVNRLRSGVDGWDGVCVRDAAALALLARRVGLVVIQDGGDFRHTAGIFLVGSDGRVVAYEPSSNKQTLVLAIQEALQTRHPPTDG
jgi:cytochrome oxidase Cu insertion factor (SCO1/SenC/PrrC family)